MAEKGFTILFDNSASEGGKRDRKTSSASAAQTASKNPAPMLASSTSRGSASAGSSGGKARGGSVQGPFTSKTQIPELSQLRLTDEGIKTIIAQEGYEADAYPDAAGYSVGYGHYLGDGETGKGTTITPEEGLKYLAKDLASFEKSISRKITAPLTDEQFTAIASFTYNAGAGPLDRGIAKKINAGDFEGAAAQMKLYNKSKDPLTNKLVKNDALVARREFETGLLLGKK